MSSISDALGGGSSPDLSNASLGDQILGGTGDFGTGAGSDAFASAGNNFPSFSSLINAFSGGQGGNPPIASAAPGTAAAAELPSGGAQGDPVAAQGGTQSNVSPGQAPQQGQQPRQTQTAYAEQPDQRPATATDELRRLLDNLMGKPSGPTGFRPQPPRTPTVPGALNAVLGDQGMPPIVVRKGSPAPPYEPGDTGAPPAPEATQSGPEADANPPAAAPDPLPGPGGAPMPQPATPQQADPRQMSRVMQDIAGISHGNPMALFDLASLLYGVGAPLAALHSQRPHGGFAPVGAPLHYGFRPFGFPQAQSQEDWEDQERAQGARDALFDKNGQPSPTGAFDRNGAFVKSPDKTPASNQIPGVTPKIADDYWRQGAAKRGMDPDIASKVLGAESGYGQNNINRRDVNGYPDYGPAQLNMAPGALGDQFYKQTGQNPANFAQNWKQQMDFALDHIAKEGWTDLYPGTSKKLGLSRWSGINRPAPAVTSSLTGTDARASFLVG